MEFPLPCSFCGSENWVDLDSPELCRLNNLVVVEEYTCETCGGKIKFFYYTRSMEDALTKLKSLDPSKPNFLYYFQKTLRKVMGIREKYNGKSQYSNQIST